MRITQRAVALTSLQGLNRNLDSVGKLQQQLTSGLLISAPSDSPTGTNRAMQIRSAEAAAEQQARNLGDARSWMDQTDSTLQNMITTTQRVRALTVQGANTGGLSPASQQALSTEVAALRESLLGLANTASQGRPLFGGVTSGSAAYSAAGAWVGQGGAPINRRVSDTEQVRIDITGPEAFGPPGADLFAVVGKIANDMVTNPAALSADLGALDNALQGMLAAVAGVGARASRIENAHTINTDLRLTLSSQRSETENIDLPETIMKLEMQKVGYQAALSATAKALQPTLLDFLR